MPITTEPTTIPAELHPDLRRLLVEELEFQSGRMAALAASLRNLDDRGCWACPDDDLRDYIEGFADVVAWQVYAEKPEGWEKPVTLSAVLSGRTFEEWTARFDAIPEEARDWM